MAVTYNVGTYGVVHAFQVKEGNLTMETVQDIGGEELKPQLTNPVRKGNPVKIAGDLLFENASVGDTIIGYAYANPTDWTSRPLANADDGEYERRYCSLDLKGMKIKTVQLEATNSKIVAGDRIKAGTTTLNCFDKGTASNNAIALEGADANSGAKIAVLFGAYD